MSVSSWPGSAAPNRLPDEAEAITTDQLARMSATLSTDTLIGLRDRALLLDGFAGAFRRGELVTLRVEHLFPPR